MVHNSTLFTLKTLCVYKKKRLCVSLLESLVMTRVICHDSSHSLTRVNVRSSQSQVRVISQVTRVKSSHLGEISSQVESIKKLRLESTRVRVSDLTCYNTDKIALKVNCHISTIWRMFEEIWDTGNQVVCESQTDIPFYKKTNSSICCPSSFRVLNLGQGNNLIQHEISQKCSKEEICQKLTKSLVC